jgi:hypothetical protein
MVDEREGARNACVGYEKYSYTFVLKPEVMRQLGELSVDVRIILTLFFDVYGVRIETRFI